ncbi:alpha/beta hydrolase [Arcticibacter eurypsychrophilus]|uniref:alpha/beta hydrolase n=1 Tax=Arcticibacter eurypsychrophilus TaxID=1434752 RepID=UPI00084DE35B|nr:alpha/beta hydrolase [Arcticibacter eurypsychrophilus]
MRFKITLVISLCLALHVQAQEFIPLWPKGKMPNSKGMALKDSIANERIFRVGTPGMFAYFPSKTENKGAAVLICPGGGYERLAYVISGTQLAKWFNTMGVSAFVLNYRLPNSPDLVEREKGPLQDAQRAIKIIRANSIKWAINSDKIGIQGSSSGGHLAALTSVAEIDLTAIGDSLDKISMHPNFSILVSPVIDLGTFAHVGSRKNLLGENPSNEMIKKYSPYLNVTASTAPSFIVHAFNDKSVNVKNSLLFFQTLVDKNIPSSLHIFPQGGHAIALRNNPGSTEMWTGLCERWMIEMNFILERILSK